ncbi:MAG: MBL fold metallo-hydrolase [Patescibacteria group bacterium]
MHTQPTIQFCGGTGTVTGACYLLTAGKEKILVDCGLYQGGRFLEDENHKPFPFNPHEVKTVFITHAHADHIGRLPKLYRDGFRGTVITTPMTADLMAVMLEDALKIMSHECDARGEKPLYTKQDLDGVLELVKPSNYNQRVTLSDSIDVYLRDSAHILGSSLIEMHIGDDIVVFTGDLGNVPAPLLKTIYPVEYCDYLCMESVYGDRIHESHQEKERILERALEDTYSKKGVLIIPVFALERTQALLSALDELIEHNRVPRMPVFLDSPLAINATKVYRKYQSLFNEDTQQLLRGGNDLFSFPGLKLTASREESIAINEVPPPKVILAGNPHGYGSRIAHHFLRALPDPNSTVLFVGYARVSSLGRMLCDGAKSVRIGDVVVPVRATITTISGYSAHADQNQLKAFVNKINKPIQQIFVTMGEQQSSEVLAQVLRDELGVPAVVPKFGDTVSLESPALAPSL